jgi:hypothetical protein
MRTFLLWVLVCFLVVGACLIYPVYVIRPFRAQGPRELMLALNVLRYRPFVVVLCSVVSLAVMVWYWRRETRQLRRSAAGLCVGLVAGLALLSRVNIYEVMFHPFDRPLFSKGAEAKLDGDEKVISVSMGREARAYPIRIISYHHIVNDVVDGVPIVATY